MSVRGRPLVAAMTVALLSGAALVPSSSVLGSDISVPAVPPIRAVGAHDTAAPLADLSPILDTEASEEAATSDDSTADAVAAAQPDDAELHCLAKIVHHESFDGRRGGCASFVEDA